MGNFLSASQFFPLLLTVLAFSIGSFIQRHGNLAILNPLLLGSLLVILVLKQLDISNASYQAGCRVLSYLLTPATICLAISFYEQFHAMKKHMPAVLLGLILGSLACMGSIWLLSPLLGLDRVLTLSLLPKSITTAIGVPVSEEIGGIGALTSACIAITGVLANMAGPFLCRILRIREPIAQGAALGTAGHVIGTARAAELGQLTGAVSSFALTCDGIFTTIVLSFAAQ